MIVRMRHLDLVCMASEKDAALERLRQLGVVHLDFAPSAGEGVTSAKGEAADAEKAVRMIRKSRGKTPFGQISLREHDVAYVLELGEDRDRLSEAGAELEQLVQEYASYGDFDPALAAELIEKVDGLRETLDIPAKLPPMRLSKMQEKLSRIRNRIAIDEAKIAGCDEAFILRSFPELADKIAFESARELMVTQGELCAVSGWIPVTAVDAFKLEMSKSGWGALLRDPLEGETPPVLVEPPKIFRPVKALFDGLGIAPGYTEADVSVPFMCYFTLFFAMLVGDGAYGLIFLASTLALRKRLARSWFVLMTVFSCATVLWGLLSNTWFGTQIPWCADWPTVVWLADPSYGNMMLLCFTIGASHLMLARVWNGICRLNSLECLVEFGWAGVLLFMYFVVNSIVGIMGGVPSWAYWVFGVSVLMIVSKTRGIELGMLPLNIMGSMGDIISYVRLFAVGYASLQVAQNFNEMALAFDLPLWAKAIPAVLILLFGHLLNLMLAGLAVLVHAVRLNTLEFSTHKGLTWSGRKFNPFKKNR